MPRSGRNIFLDRTNKTDAQSHLLVTHRCTKIDNGESNIKNLKSIKTGSQSRSLLAHLHSGFQKRKQWGLKKINKKLIYFLKNNVPILYLDCNPLQNLGF